MAGADFRDAAKNRLNEPALAFQHGFAFRRDRIELARPLGRIDANQSLLLKQGEGRIDDTGARRIGASQAVLDRLDDFIAMRRLFADEFQNNEADVALAEHSAPPAKDAEMPVPAARTPCCSFALRARL